MIFCFLLSDRFGWYVINLSLCFYSTIVQTIVPETLDWSGRISMKKLIPAYSIIVVDEAQDMNDLYFKNVLKLLQDRHAANPDAKR